MPMPVLVPMPIVYCHLSRIVEPKYLSIPVGLALAPPIKVPVPTISTIPITVYKAAYLLSDYYHFPTLRHIMIDSSFSYVMAISTILIKSPVID